MIHPNQLRLGNYLLNKYHGEGRLVKVTLIDKHHIGCIIEGVKVDLCYKFECYDPIPLTGKLISNLNTYSSLKIGSNDEGFFYYSSSGQFTKLNYLHQLQNLYFAVTGEELPVTTEMIAVNNELLETTF